MSTDDDTTITTPWHRVEMGTGGVFIDGEQVAEGLRIEGDCGACARPWRDHAFPLTGACLRAMEAETSAVKGVNDYGKGSSS